tara:strand:- start:142 stop:402 length:261 start_codon:yes stop_codon:yes gene_type:complete
VQVFLNQLVAWSLLLDAQFFKKLFTAPEICIRQRAMVLNKPWQQIIFCKSHATSLVDPAGEASVTDTEASVSIQTLAPQLKGLSGL